MRKIVSYALFAHGQGGSWKSDGTPGRLDGYIRFLPTIIRAHHVLWPGWELHLHFDDITSAHRYMPALRRMEDRGLILGRYCGAAGDVGAAPMWRFQPAFDHTVTSDSIVLCHDIDSFPGWTTRMCAEEFVASSAAAAVIHGCESHNTAMAGLFLLRINRFRYLTGCSSFDAFMQKRAARWDWYGADEHYLRDVIWPELEREAMLLRVGNSGHSLINAPDVRYRLTRPDPNDVPIEAMTATMRSFELYPGAAGYNREAAMEWFDALAHDHGHKFPALVAIDACEQGVATGREISRL